MSRDDDYRAIRAATMGATGAATALAPGISVGGAAIGLAAVRDVDPETSHALRARKLQGVSDAEFAASLAAVESGAEPEEVVPRVEGPLAALGAPHVQAARFAQQRPSEPPHTDRIATASAALARMALEAAARLGDDEASVTVRVSLRTLAELHGWTATVAE